MLVCVKMRKSVSCERLGNVVFHTANSITPYQPGVPRQQIMEQLGISKAS